MTPIEFLDKHFADLAVIIVALAMLALLRPKGGR